MRNRQTVAAVVKVYFVARRRIKIRDPLLYFTSTLGRKSTEVLNIEPVINVLYLGPIAQLVRATDS